MNDDKRDLSAEEIAEIRKIMDAIKDAMKSIAPSDANMIIALAEILANVTVMHAAGQAVYEGKNPAESISKCVKAVAEVVLDALSRATYRFPDTLQGMRAEKAEGINTEAETMH